ncbi:hypothetical protein FBEOM_14130 [Fusarium beomiforme]|uniref:Uncharacterized protein n=1 Tax=Fusarium beomiforme TaxID=44412 RepID=A0A9P5A5R8_9HYPO|nr:hypothetical protein FBEOM_14130 [Fusarium beomiforme]
MDETTPYAGTTPLSSRDALPNEHGAGHHYCYSVSSKSASSNSDIAAESASAVAYGLGMDSSQLPIASVEVLRCMRCARSVEATSTDDIGVMGMVRIAHNLYYCERCAKMVWSAGGWDADTMRLDCIILLPHPQLIPFNVINPHLHYVFNTLVVAQTGLVQGCGSATAHGKWRQAVVDAKGTPRGRSPAGRECLDRARRTSIKT